MPKLFSRKRNLIAFIVPVSLAFLFLVLPPFRRVARSVSIKVITAPFVAVNSGISYFRSKKGLQRENSLLRQEVAELSLKIERDRTLAEENTRLRDLLDFKGRIRYDTVSAEVIARDPDNWIGAFTINKGASDGIKRGAAVCSAEGLVGRIADLDKRTSSVMLVTNPAFRAGGMLRDSRLHGVVEGDGMGLARMLYLPLDAEIKEGEVVVTSGFSREFPKGIVIGKIVSVGRSRTGLFKTAVLEPAVNAYDQEEVLCLK